MTLFQILNLVIAICTMLVAAYRMHFEYRSMLVFIVEAMLIALMSELIFSQSPNTLLAGIVAFQTFYVIEMLQQLKSFVLKGLLQQALLALVLVCAGAAATLLLQGNLSGWFQILGWALLAGTLILTLIDPVKRAIALRKDAHWLKKRG